MTPTAVGKTLDETVILIVLKNNYLQTNLAWYSLGQSSISDSMEIL